MKQKQTYRMQPTPQDSDSTDEVQPIGSKLNLIIATVNCRSLCNALSDIQALLISEFIDIMCVTETWLTASKPDAVVTIPGYTMFRRDRGETNCDYAQLGGGGVVVYIKQSIQAVRRTDLECETLEILMVELKSRTPNLLVAALYRPPRQQINTLKEQFQLLAELVDSHDIIIGGDFNAYNNNWNAADTTNSDGRTLQAMLDEGGIVVCNRNMGTRPTPHSNHQLDLILSNCPHKCMSSFPTPPIADHCAVVATFRTTLATESERTKRMRSKMKRYNLGMIRQLLTQDPLYERVQGEVHIDYAWKAWETHFRDITEKCTYWVNVPPAKKPWYSWRLSRLKKCQDRLFRRYVRLPSVDNRISYCVCRNAYRKKVRTARSHFLTVQGYSLANRCRIGGYTWWKRAKRLCNITQKSYNIPELMSQTTCAKTARAKAQLLAEHFAAQSSSNSYQNPTPSQSVANSLLELFSIPPLTEGDVEHALSHLSPRTATSDSELIPVFRTMADLLSVSLTYLFNRSLALSTFPTDWKLATITPIFKKRGDPSNPSNYRPISLLSALSRILEEHVATSLSNFLYSNKLITPVQFGFVRHKSTTLQLIVLAHRIAQLQDSHAKLSLVSLDFHKAFDRVHHPTLLESIKQIAKERTTRWFSSYLEQRSIRVKVENTMSASLDINCGVPQGSHLAPLLFALYINTLPETVKHSEVFLYADDVALLHQHQKPAIGESYDQNHLQQDIDACYNWAKTRHGTFSSSKTTVVTTLDQPSTLRLNGEQLATKSSIKHLGITLTTQLNFSIHFDEIRKVFVQRVNLLRYMARNLPGRAILLLYKSYVRPSVEYAIPVWYCRLTREQQAILDKFQAKICRCYLRSQKIEFDQHETKENLNILCNLESLQFRRQSHSLVTLFKIIHNHSEYLTQFCISVTTSKRRPNKLVFHSYSRLLSSLFFYRTGQLWNCLPPVVTAIESLEEFKKQLKIHTFKYRFNCNGIGSVGVNY